MNFGEAQYSMGKGKAVARAGWNGKGMFIVLMPEFKLAAYSDQTALQKVNDRTAKWVGPDTPMTIAAYYALYTAQGIWQPGWTANQADMLAVDWSEVEPAYGTNPPAAV